MPSYQEKESDDCITQPAWKLGEKKEASVASVRRKEIRNNIARSSRDGSCSVSRFLRHSVDFEGNENVNLSFPGLTETQNTM